jgi:hypothetical protein
MGVEVRGTNHRVTEDTEARQHREEKENELVYHTLHTILQKPDVEVDQEPQALIAEPEIREELSLVNGFQLLNSLQLDDEAILNMDVHDQIVTEVHAFVRNRHALLGNVMRTAEAELVARGALVNRFQ